MEKTAVFRDPEEQEQAPTPMPGRDPAASLTAPASHRKSPQALHAKNLERIALDLPPRQDIPSMSHVEDEASYQPSLVAQLQALGARREGLLRQLSVIEEEESLLLTKLQQSMSQSSVEVSIPQTQMAPPVTPSLALGAVKLLCPIPSPSRLPRIQPSKTSRKPLHHCAALAPSIPAPSVMRPALVGAESAKSWDAANCHSQRPDETHGTTAVPTPILKSTVTLLPTNFGDEGENVC